MFCKIGVLKNFATFAGKKPVLKSLLNKAAGLQACNFIKKRLQFRFSCEYCEVFKNNFFYRTPSAAASDIWIQVC